MGASNGTDGGFLVPSQLSPDVSNLLRPASVVRRLGARTVPIPNGNLALSKVTAGSSAAYLGENLAIATSQMTVGQVKLTFKKLAAFVPISNSLLRYSGPGMNQIDALIAHDAALAIGARENQAFLRDDGTQGTPVGIRHWAPDANLITSAGTTLANMITDLTAAMSRLADADVPDTEWAWFMSPRTRNSLMTVAHTNGGFAFKDEMVAGTLMKYPYAVSTQMPGTGGTGETYLVNMADVVIGENGLIVAMATNGTYVDATTGATVSAFAQDQSLVRVIAEHDLTVRRGASVVVVQGMSY